MSEFGLDVERGEDRVAWITVRNPKRLNAIRLEMWRAIPELIATLASDPSVNVCVIRGAGTAAFASGADISEFESVRKDAASAAEYEAVTTTAFDALLGLEKPLIAMIRGACIGGGLAVATCADVRLASTDAQFALPAARLGLGYHASGVRRLVDLVGPGMTAEIFFAALQYDADEALRMGLVTRVLPAGDIEGFTRAYAGAMAANAPLTQQAAKLAIADALADPADRDGAAVERRVAACFASEDYAEGIRAFLTKRRPKFQGK